jgi:8-oxo-dGTP pyrophosphatase MutT (NUDIX family)
MRAYKIYFAEVQILIISRNPTHFIGKKVNINKLADFEVDKVISSIKTNTLTENICFVIKNPSGLFKYFQKQFEFIKAAGGVVLNSKGEILFIYKYHKWDLPKGGIELNESSKEAAIREVREECGVRNLEVKREIGKTYHIGKIGQKIFLKKTYWFEMLCNDPENIKPEAREGIIELKWVKLTQNPEILNQTYHSLHELLNNL